MARDGVPSLLLRSQDAFEFHLDIGELRQHLAYIHLRFLDSGALA